MEENQSKEIWKPIPGFGEIYSISTHGRVLAKECIRQLASGRTIRTQARFIGSTPKSGYPWVLMCCPHTRARRAAMIHVLVAEAFIGPQPTQKHQINHIDGNKKNPKVSNLEWVTPTENCNHALKTGLRQKGTFLEFNGERLRITDWARRLKIPIQTLFTRYYTGYSAAEILSKSLYENRRKKISLTKKAQAPKYKNELSAIEWAAKLGISRAAFLWRIKHFQREEDIYVMGPIPNVLRHHR